MIATLLGALPRPTVDAGGRPIVAGGDRDPDADVVDDLVVAAVRAQEEAGLEPITDGRLRDPSFERLGALLLAADGSDRAVAAVLEGWRALAASTERAAKQALPGPYSLGRRPRIEPGERESRTLTAAESLAAVVDALALAGCPLIEIEETEAHHIGGDEAERRLFREAHRRLTIGGSHGSEIHRSLSIVGGSAAGAGAETILDAPYVSLAVDLIAGPDNWYLVRALPGERGVIAGVLSARDRDEDKEVMLWGSKYAAASRRRGAVRVGLGSAGSWASCTWETAVRKLGRLREAVRLASMPPSEELARELDPRAVSIRRAALGHDAQPPPRRRKRPTRRP